MAEITRRDLIVGGSAVALGAAGIGRAAQEPKPVGWAIMGLGSYATRQIMPAFKDCKHSKIVALVSGSAEKAKRYGTEYGVPESAQYNYETIERMRENPEIDVVYVITPPGTHREFTVRSARAGKHVCCEKPMANTAAECEEMVRVCKENSRLLQMGYRCHYEAHNLRAMQIVREGGVGKVRTILAEAGFRMGPGAWRTNKALAGGGALWDIGIYALQAAIYLAGEEPTEVIAMVGSKGAEHLNEVDDITNFSLLFPSGAIANCATGYSWSGINRYEVIGDRGRMSADNATGYGGHQFRHRGQPMEVQPNNQFAAQIDAFSLAVRGADTNVTPGEMGLRDIRILEAVLKSAAEKRAVQL